MNGFNSFQFIGHLTHDPTQGKLKDGSPVLNFSIAVNFSKDAEPNYFEMTAYSEKAERWDGHIKKGSRVFVAGYQMNNRWQDKNGTTHREIRYVVEKLVYLDPPPPQ